MLGMVEGISKTRKLVAKTAKKYGKIAGAVGSLANAAALQEEGYNFISMGADAMALWDYYKDLAEGIKKL